jgi:hypothetical protein
LAHVCRKQRCCPRKLDITPGDEGGKQTLRPLAEDERGAIIAKPVSDPRDVSPFERRSQQRTALFAVCFYQPAAY